MCSTAELAAELERYLDGKPILARSIGPIERTYRWCRREPALAAMALLLCLGLVIGFH